MGVRTPAHRAAAEAVERVNLALEGDGCSVRGLVPDAAGRLRAVASAGPPSGLNGHGAALRRSVLREGVGAVVPITRAADPEPLALGAFPVGAGADPIAVLEVVGPADRLARRETLISVLSIDAARRVLAEQERERARRALDGMRGLFRHTSELLRSDRRTAAVRAATEACAMYFETPAIGLLPDRSGIGWYLVAFPGAGRRRYAAAEGAAARTPSRGRPELVSEELASAVGEATRLSRLRPIEAWPAVLLVPAEVRSHAEFASSISIMLGDALRHQQSVSLANDRNARFDLGIAWTAHELRGPVAAARHALEHALRDPAEPENHELIGRAREELEHLEAIVLPLLRWSAGEGELRRLPVDLVPLVRAGIAESSLEADDDRIRLRSPDSMIVSGDELELRCALTNLLRNALAYSPPGTEVEVEVSGWDGVAAITVRDLGPGVAPKDRDRIFDPLARAAASSAQRGNRGLGLYIARRVAEAHGGALRILPTRQGCLFSLELPLSAQEGAASAAS